MLQAALSFCLENLIFQNLGKISRISYPLCGKIKYIISKTWIKPENMKDQRRLESTEEIIKFNRSQHI